MPKVIVPPPFRGPTQGNAEIEVEGRTVLECIEAVETRYPGFRVLVLDGANRPHKFVSLFRNGERLELTDLDGVVADGDELQVLAAVAGG
jgi:molybdopterin converting factor small subunit